MPRLSDARQISQLCIRISTLNRPHPIVVVQLSELCIKLLFNWTATIVELNAVGNALTGMLV